MTKGKITVDNSVRGIPKSEQTKQTDINQKNKSWLTPSETEQKFFRK